MYYEICFADVLFMSTSLIFEVTEWAFTLQLFRWIQDRFIAVLSQVSSQDRSESERSKLDHIERWYRIG